MKQVKIVNGTYGYCAPGARFITPVAAGEIVSVSDEEAKRLVRLGIAMYDKYSTQIDTGVESGEPSTTLQGGGNDTDDQSAEGDSSDEDGETAQPMHSYSVDLKADQLRAIMEQNGVPVKTGMTKADMVAALDMHFSNDEDEAPPLGAADPVL